MSGRVRHREAKKMGKIVKYCSSCDEGFSEKFSFCPNCSAALQPFEMNPVNAEASAVVEPTVPAAPAFIAEPVVETNGHTVADEVVFEADADEVDLEYDDSEYDRMTEEVPYTTPFYASTVAADDGYHITVIEETNGTQRNGLLLAATVFMIMVVGGATVYSLFIKPLDVGAIGNDQSLAFLTDIEPVEVEEVKEKKNKDDAGGGGGGGREEETPASRGDLADQTKNPIRPPDAKIPRLDNPSLVLPPPSTEGNMKFEKKYNKWGLPNGLDGLTSNGTGSGGGLGNGYGPGQGNGTGTGAGNGTGSGYGNGNGNGNGNGTGDGDNGNPPPSIAKVTTPLKILAKPRASYTDEARAQNVQGTVRLKVTLLASGGIGSITPLTRLPYGLTEQAIAAARQIRFDPKKINGQAQSVSMTFEYNFSIY
jgi:TonB family protein